MSATSAGEGRIWYTQHDSPVGLLLLAADESGLRHIHFQAGPSPLRPGEAWCVARTELDEARRQLDTYFAGQRREFSLTLAPRGTAFQLRVWEALRSIRYGSTLSYGELARRLGTPGASRAVGLANGRNPLPIVVPCHRVVGADGSLTGFGGGLAIKQSLLELEGVLGTSSAQGELFPGPRPP